MSEDEEIPTRPDDPPEPGGQHQPARPAGRGRADWRSHVDVLWERIDHTQEQLAALKASLQKVARLVAEVRDQQKDLAVQVQQLVDTEPDEGGDDRQHRPAPWVIFPPPPAAEDKEHQDQNPLFTLAMFVEFYNRTYVGLPGSRAVPIPVCWLNHPGLVAELATLAYAWRSANLGPSANIQQAEYWHHHWRPGFAARLATEWTHTHCRTDGHKQTGAPARLDRFTLAEQPTPGAEQPSTAPEQHTAPPAGGALPGQEASRDDTTP
ncbi:hypothetical protein [Amycolatopsis anabasis]|uniref:hypothetical protein n=1 Tax=Amycolatopsis anabasis TaxID=1840409 RepID=UPI00131DD7B2|nr:hypothetical protein [Amycolatopsis anabasis]